MTFVIYAARLPSPVLADKREQAVFDLVPLARTGWKVTDRYGQLRFVSQPGFIGRPGGT
jgi:hypothetical protein